MPDPGERLDKLSPAKRALLARRMAEKRARGGAGHAPAFRADRTQPLRLSYSQERFWFFAQLEPECSVDVLSGGAILRGPFDEAAFRAAVADLVARHEVLRTTYPAEDGVPRQLVHENVAVAFSKAVDVVPPNVYLVVPEAGDDEGGGLDVGTGPVLQVTLSPGGVSMLQHHICGDGWSRRVMFRDLRELYLARVEGREPVLPELPWQYADFAAWQRAHLEGERMAAHLAFWRRELENAPSGLDLPCDRPRGSAPTADAGSSGCRLGASTSSLLRSVAAARGTTPFLVLVTLFQAWLARLARTGDVVVGTSHANRDVPGVADLIGCFVNTLVLRARFTEVDTLSSAVRAASERWSRVQEHVELPFECLVEHLAPERDAGRTPLFDVFFEQLVPAHAGDWGPLTVEPYESPAGEVAFDLTLSADLSGADVGLTWIFRSDRLELGTIEAWAVSFTVFVTACLQEPERPLRELPWCTEPTDDEEAPTTVARPRWEPWPRPNVLAQCRVQPETVAGALRARGLEPGAFVGVLLPRSPEALAAAVGVWLAGGCYVPLDPAAPARRLALELEDLGHVHVVTDATTRELLGSRDVSVLLLDELADGSGSRPDTLTLDTDPEDACYAIFTSGSTGRPKGLVVPHRALANDVAWILRALRVTAADRILLRTPFAFDAALWEWVPAFAAGADVVLAPLGLELDPRALVELVRDERITVLQTVPSLLAAWTREPGFSELRDLRLLVCGGEALPRALAERVATLLPRAELWNLYGPAETGIDATAWRWDPRAPRVSIGTPIDGVRTWVRDARGGAVPSGAVGELWIGGAGVGLGYLGNDGLTGERFVPAPDGRGRAYRTGDLVRRGSSGELELVGRSDEQLKLGGVRVEPAEIEGALLTLEGVREVAVVAQDHAELTRLVAFVVADEQDFDEDHVLARLVDRLPRALVPARVVRRDALPRTATEKVDKAALRAVAPPPRVEAGAGPRDELEASVCELFAELLGAPSVSPRADFFRLGGHSLLAVRLAARVRERLGRELPLLEFFEAPTPRAVADRVRRRGVPVAGEVRPEVPRLGLDARAPLLPTQERLWMLDRIEDASAAYTIPGALRLRGRLDVGALERAWDALARGHDALRTVLGEDDDGPFQRLIQLPPCRLDVADVDEHELPAALERDARHPFDLQRGPLFRLRLYRLGLEDHCLFVALHHAVADGWSLEVLLEDLAQLYTRALDEPRPDLPEPELGPRDLAAHLRATWTAEHRTERLKRWREILDRAPRVLELPLDRLRPATFDPRGRSLVRTLSTRLAGRVREASAELGVSPHAVCLCAYALLLARLSRAASVTIGLPVAQRELPGTERLVGMLVNTCAIPLAVDPDQTFARFAEATGARLPELAFDLGDVPFEHVVAALVPERDPSRAPLFQAAFDFAAVEPGARTWSAGARALEVELVPVEPGTSKFDLSLAIEDDGRDLRARFEYPLALFDRGTIERWARLYETLLEACVTEPGARLGTLEWLDRDARDEELAHAVRPVHPWEPTRTALHLFEEQVALRPDAIAVRAGERELTYAELDAQATALAAELRRSGVGHGDRVMVRARRSPQRTAALLAVWRAGAAWVAVDPDDHPERRRAIGARAGVRLEVVDTDADAESGLAYLPLGSGFRAGRSGVPPGARPDELAYVVPTSGSTGEPKLVAVSHRALAHHCQLMPVLLGLDETDAILDRGPLHFDGSLIEWLPPLCFGGTQVQVSSRDERDPALVLRAAREGRATAMLAVPTFLRELLAVEGAFEAWSSLRTMLIGGEALVAGPVRELLRRRPDLRCFNLYGPSETTIQVAYHEVHADALGPDESPVPIGTVWPNCTGYVLDERGELAPVGTIGELVLGGACLSEGYLGEAERTAEVFVPDPLDPGRRVYRTGDLVRRRSDGALVFEARRDRQLKLRGVRVEPAEIEAALARVPGVVEAAVGPGARGGLVAHLAGPDLPRDAAALAARLAEHLPRAWRPNELALHERLPRLASGKLDANALERAVRLELAARSEPARTAHERLAAEAFAAVLGIEPPGRDDDFFLLGGSSLDAIALARWLRQHRHLELPLRELFAVPTVAELGCALEALERPETEHRPSRAPGLDLAAEAHLDTSIAPVPRQRGVGPRRLLLTGATGFLGAFVLRELLDRASGTVACVVRARDADAALARVHANLDRYGLSRAGDAERIEALAGDLAAPRLGLDRETWHDLVERLDGAIHSGAAVDFFADYRRLRAANVGSTVELLRLCCEAGGAPLHFVSTLGVFLSPSARHLPRLAEDTDLVRHTDLEEGYEQTKWVAEQLVLEAGRRGLPVTIHRPGRIVGSSASGVWNDADFASRVFRACLALGAYPEIDAPIDATPVDWCARALVSIALDERRPPGPFHLANPRPFPFVRFFERARAAGLSLEPQPFDRWLHSLRGRARREPGSDLALVAAFLEAGGLEHAERELLPDADLPPVDFANLDAAMGEGCPPVDDAMVDRWIDRFTGTVDVR